MVTGLLVTKGGGELASLAHQATTPAPGGSELIGMSLKLGAVPRLGRSKNLEAGRLLSSAGR